MAAREYITFFDGFEGQTANRWQAVSGGALETSIVSLSRAAWRWNVSAGTGYVTFKPVGAATDGTWPAGTVGYCWISFHLYIATLPGGANRYYLFRTTDTAINRRSVSINSSGNIEVRGEGSPGAVEATSAGALATGRWYVVSIRSIYGASNYVYCVVRDRDTGATVAEATGTSTTDTFNQTVQIGPYFTSTGDCIFDNLCCVYSGTLANVGDPVSFLTTRHAVGTLVPDIDGYYDDASNDYSYVDEIPIDSDTSYRAITGASGAVKGFTQGFAPTTTLAAAVGAIYGMSATIYARATTTGVNARIRLRVGATDYDSAETTDLPSALPYACRFKNWLTNPYTLSDWQVSDIDGSEAGCFRESSNANEVRCTAVYCDLLYSVSSVFRKKKVALAYQTSDPMNRILGSDGVALPLNEVKSNAWMFVGDVFDPTAKRADSFFEDDAMTYLEEVTYSQTEEAQTLAIVPSPDDFAETLIRRLSESSAGGL